MMSLRAYIERNYPRTARFLWGDIATNGTARQSHVSNHKSGTNLAQVELDPLAAPTLYETLPAGLIAHRTEADILYEEGFNWLRQGTRQSFKLTQGSLLEMVFPGCDRDWVTIYVNNRGDGLTWVTYSLTYATASGQDHKNVETFPLQTLDQVTVGSRASQWISALNYHLIDPLHFTLQLGAQGERKAGSFDRVDTFHLEVTGQSGLWHKIHDSGTLIESSELALETRDEYQPELVGKTPGRRVVLKNKNYQFFNLRGMPVLIFRSNGKIWVKIRGQQPKALQCTDEFIGSNLSGANTTNLPAMPEMGQQIELALHFIYHDTSATTLEFTSPAAKYPAKIGGGTGQVLDHGGKAPKQLGSSPEAKVPRFVDLAPMTFTQTGHQYIDLKPGQRLTVYTPDHVFMVVCDSPNHYSLGRQNPEATTELTPVPGRHSYATLNPLTIGVNEGSFYVAYSPWA